MQLTAEVLSEWISKPLEELKEVNASRKEITRVGNLSACTNLRKLNLSQNSLDSPEAIIDLRHIPELTVLNLANNELTSLDGLHHLKSLKVLNMSHNGLSQLSVHVSKLTQLNALVLSNNKLQALNHIDELVNINTIVVSHNALTLIPSLPKLKGLKKLSAAHNQLNLLPDLSMNVELKEGRFNDNKIAKISDSLRQCGAIETLDLGNNALSEWSDIAPLGSLLNLHNLNLKGNPLADKEDYIEKILDLVPSLRILDGTRFDAKFLERKKKQKANPKITEKKQRLKREKMEKLEKGLLGDEGTEERKPRHKKLLKEAIKETAAAEEKPGTKGKAQKAADGTAKRVSKRTIADTTSTDKPASNKKKVARRDKEPRSETTLAKTITSTKRKATEASSPAEKATKKSKLAANKTEKKNTKSTSTTAEESIPTGATVKATKTGKSKKKDADEFFATDTTPAAETKASKKDVTGATVDASTKAASKEKPQPTLPTTTKEMRSGVVSVVDKSKKMKKKLRTGAEALFASLEGNQESESTGTGLDVGGWD